MTLLGAFISKGERKSPSISEQRKGLGIAQALSILRPPWSLRGPKSVQMTLLYEMMLLYCYALSSKKIFLNKRVGLFRVSVLHLRQYTVGKNPYLFKN